MTNTKKPVKTKKREMQSVPSAIARIKATFNNTIIAITDQSGRVIAWSSAGKVNFSGSRKSSAFAATVAAQDVGKAAKSRGVIDLDVIVQGPGAGRESAIRALQGEGFTINSIRDVTPVPHNGCRAPKRRRV